MFRLVSITRKICSSHYSKLLRPTPNACVCTVAACDVVVTTLLAQPAFQMQAAHNLEPICSWRLFETFACRVRLRTGLCAPPAGETLTLPWAN
mmetsp:Transcript_61582/g.121872  ORF Transcript_61582/g.121872 Transcript_61582/m.121872 type:complete len:93 (-) Transcript_61582:247-525(-)